MSWSTTGVQLLRMQSVTSLLPAVRSSRWMCAPKWSSAGLATASIISAVVVTQLQYCVRHLHMVSGVGSLDRDAMPWVPRLQADNAQRRARVCNYPRLWQMHAVIPLPRPDLPPEGALVESNLAALSGV